MKQIIALTGLIVWAPCAVTATTPSAIPEDAARDTITVTATRAPIAVVEAPATVSVITDADIEDLLIDDIKDLVRFEPGVSVRTQPSRFSAALSSTGRDGNSGFTIRGLDGNRVLIQTDGIRLPDAFAFGAQSAGRGDYADLDLIKSVEILRGPTSALYGSDGLAGAVSLTTKDPEDLISQGQSTGLRTRLGYASVDTGWATSGAFAATSGALSGLIAYTRRDTGPVKNKGTVDTANTLRTVPNPQETDANGILAKIVWSPLDGYKLRFTYEHQDRDTTTDVLSARALPPLGSTSTLSITAADTLRRDRVSLDWRYAGTGLVKSASVVAYHQTSRTRQFTAEDRNTAADRTRDNSFDNRVTGVGAQLDLGFATGTLDHRVIFGGDYSQTRQEGARNGTIPPMGEVFPTRAFPITDHTQAGFFIQDSLSVADGRLVIYPALRFDYYKLLPQADPTFPGTPARQSGQRLSPKLGAVGWVSDTIGLYASYAQGFRSPTPSQVNNGFANPIQNYTSIAAPGLRPETSSAFEGGLRLRDFGIGGLKLSGNLTGFTARYRDFIEQRQISGAFTPANPAVFQYVNVGRVDIDGVEARVDMEFGSGFGANIAAAWVDGRAQGGSAAQTPLSSVDPFKVVAGLRWRGLSDRVAVQLIATHSAGKAQSDIAESCSPTCFAPAGFTVVDATASFAILPQAIVRVGIFNLFDRKYFWWSDTRGLSANLPTIDAYSQAGRNASLSLTLKL